MPNRHFSRILVALVALLATASAWAQKVGSEAPEFEPKEKLNYDSSFSLQKFRGKIVVLVFWRTTDSASIDLIPVLSNIHKSLGKTGVVVVAHTPEEKEPVDTVVKGKKIEYIVTLGGDGPEKYGVSAFPRAFLIDTKGTVVWSGHPADGLEERVRAQIEKTPPAGSDSSAIKNRLARARKFFEDKEFGKAWTLYKDVQSLAGGESGMNEVLNELKKQLDENIEKWLDEAKKLMEAKDYDKGAKILAEISVRLAGEKIAEQADAEISRQQGDREVRNKLKKAVDNAKGELRNEQAADLELSRQYMEARDAYKEVVEKYPDTEAGKLAKEAIERIGSDPKIQAFIKAAQSTDEADRWLDIADRFAKIEMFDKARGYYEKIVNDHPTTRAATKAKARLATLEKEEAEARKRAERDGKKADTTVKDKDPKKDEGKD